MPHETVHDAFEHLEQDDAESLRPFGDLGDVELRKVTELRQLRQLNDKPII
jgi:hypothetical protein